MRQPLLTTDYSLSSREVVCLYGNQRSIEVFFRDDKSLLCFGSEFQEFSYDITASSTAIVFTRYILPEWVCKKTNDPKTICELLYVCSNDMQDIELYGSVQSGHHLYGRA